MVCVYCGSDTRVTNSRSSSSAQQVWRRRRCDGCNSIFSTFEQPDLLKSLVVEHLDGKINPFSKNGLFVSIYESCKHRASAIDDASALTDTIIKKLLKANKDGVIKRSEIIKTASSVLKRFDEPASVYYLAYHKA